MNQQATLQTAPRLNKVKSYPIQIWGYKTHYLFWIGIKERIKHAPRQDVFHLYVKNILKI